MSTEHKRISLTQQAHDFVLGALHRGGIAVDATAGNGFDTCFLAEAVGVSGWIYAFDIQGDALLETQKKLAVTGMAGHVTLIHANHALMKENMPKHCLGKVQAVMFNLGYLPGSSHDTITQSDDTLVALQDAAEMLQQGGRISVLAYTGHPGGREEADAVKTWARSLPDDQFTVDIDVPERVRRSPPELIRVSKGSVGPFGHPCG